MQRRSRVSGLGVALALIGSLLLGWSLGIEADAQAQAPASLSVSPASPILGGQGFVWLPQFANPAVRGALYGTPLLPMTGYYPLYPSGLTKVMDDREFRVGPIHIHPSLGLAEMYTDNVYRTNSARQADWSHTLAPGLQLQLPFMKRHVLLADYRSNFQFFQRDAANNVADQTLSSRLALRLPSGLDIDLQGEYKHGHDPRGSALDLGNVELNKWNSQRFLAHTQYFGSTFGVEVQGQVARFDFTNNNQGIIRDNTSQFISSTVFGRVAPRTFGLVSLSVNRTAFDDNKNLDNVIYTAATGFAYVVSAATRAEVRVGYQHVTYSSDNAVPSAPALAPFVRDRDSYSRYYLRGNIDWRVSSRIDVSLQGYQAIQQIVVAGTAFVVATGANVSGQYELTSRTALTVNLGYEQDRFEGSILAGSTGLRTDTLKNAAIGIAYFPTRWGGLNLQYVLEDRRSTLQQFSYHANTIALSGQIAF